MACYYTTGASFHGEGEVPSAKEPQGIGSPFGMSISNTTSSHRCTCRPTRLQGCSTALRHLRNIGEALPPYEECDTFLNTDAGITWTMVRKNAHKYEFGEQNNILVLINNEEPSDMIVYSWDLGKNW